LKPIVVKGNRLYDSDGNEFFVKGLGFPNVGKDVEKNERPDNNVDDWIKVLKRITDLDTKKEINTVRLYELPPCATDTQDKSRCFDRFFKAADDLGIYVIVPGTGYAWGWLPNGEAFCHEDRDENNNPSGELSTQGCYKEGGVLGFGQTIVSRLTFPNTLGIAIGNEFEHNPGMQQHIPIIKAYARDMKKFMSECNTHDDSPSKGVMRQVPLIYAASDADGDAGLRPRAQYLFCDSPDVSIDMYGLNIERYCDETGGKVAYDGVNKWVKEAKLPGAFLYTEMGCAKPGKDHDGSRPWTQVENFFGKWDAVSGFAAYAYYGNKDFDMFDGDTAEAKLLEDGENFFNKLQVVGTRDSVPPPAELPLPSPTCPKQLFFRNNLHDLAADYKEVEWYSTGEAGWATSCPPAWAVLGKDNSEKSSEDSPKAVTVLSDGVESPTLTTGHQQQGFDFKQYMPVFLTILVVAGLLLLSVAALFLRRGWADARSIRKSQESPEELELPSGFANI